MVQQQQKAEKKPFDDLLYRNFYPGTGAKCFSESHGGRVYLKLRLGLLYLSKTVG